MSQGLPGHGLWDDYLLYGENPRALQPFTSEEWALLKGSIRKHVIWKRQEHARKLKHEAWVANLRGIERTEYDKIQKEKNEYYEMLERAVLRIQKPWRAYDHHHSE